MDVNKSFPLTLKIIRGDVKSLVLVIVYYLIACAVARILGRLLGWVPVLGWALNVIVWLVGIYCVIGIIIACLQYFRAAD